MALGYDRPSPSWRSTTGASFKEMYGVSGELTPEDHARICDDKSMIYEGSQRAIANGSLAKEDGGVLVDEEFGSDVPRRARSEGVEVAMPLEKSGQDEFDFDYGEQFVEHILEFDPTFSKVLVRRTRNGTRRCATASGAASSA